MLFQRQACPVEHFVLSGIREVHAQLEYSKYASATIGMLEHYYRLFWMPSPLVDVIMQILSILMQWTTLHSNELVQVLVLSHTHS